MSIDFNPEKDQVNRTKHGLALDRAIDMDLRTAVVQSDERRDYGEPRWRAYGMLGDRLHMLAFTVRDGRMRVISLRRANAREMKRYG